TRIEPDKLSRRHLTLSPQTLVRLLMGHTSVDSTTSDEGFVASTATALDAARILFPVQPIWRSPLDAATAGSGSGRSPLERCEFAVDDVARVFRECITAP